MTSHGHVRQLAQEPMGSRYIWPVPELLRRETSVATTPLEVTGLTEIYMPRALYSLSSVGIAAFNALQTLTTVHGREELFSWGDIERELREDRYGFDRHHRFWSVAFGHIADHLEDLARASDAEAEQVIIAEPQIHDLPRGSGNPLLYRFNPQIFFIDRRIISEELLIGQKHNNTAT